MLEPKDAVLPPEATPWDQDEGFRSTFLRYFSPGDAAALRRVGHLLFQGAMESHAEQQDSKSFIRSDMRSARADLLFLQGMLASLGATSEEELVDRSDFPLCRVAARLSRQIGGLAEDIAKALEMPDGPGRQPGSAR